MEKGQQKDDGKKPGPRARPSQVTAEQAGCACLLGKTCDRQHVTSNRVEVRNLALG